MQNKDKVALFDFCETIANFQTADAYVRYVQGHSAPTNKGVRMLYNILNKSRVLGVVRRLKPKGSIDKRFILKQMKGRTFDEMDRLAKEYYQNKIKPNMIAPVVAELKRLQSEGYSCYVISAGYDIYLKYFCEDFRIDGLLSTKVEFKDGICTGKFDGQDCMFEYKIDYINSAIQGDRRQWFAFSDSVTDLPMLELVGNPVVISCGKSQKWAEKRNIKQIIWNNNNKYNGCKKNNSRYYPLG